jgi:hypothetical protein
MYIFYVKLLDCMMENSYPIQLLYFIMLVAYAHFMLGIYIYTVQSKNTIDPKVIRLHTVKMQPI